MKEDVSENVRKLIREISNDFEYWLMFVIHPVVEPTNNRVEKALLGHVVLRKILGTMRNGKGTSIHERVMTMLATWGTTQGVDNHDMLSKPLKLNT